MGRKPKSEDARLITLAEGKTKIVRIIRGTNRVLIESKDDLTAGDGAKRATIPEKGILAATTTCNCFRLLRRESVPTHYIGRKGPQAFLANRVKMFPIEIVARKIATGSYLRRNPNVSEGETLNPLVWEFFLKDDASGNIVVADVIDNDSWRIWPYGEKAQMRDKQVFRDAQNPGPKELARIKANYEWVARATDKFLRD